MSTINATSAGNEFSTGGAAVLTNLLEPDVILPSQFEAVDGQGFVGGERGLMAAILADGIEAYIAHVHAGTDDGSEAAQWITTRDIAYVFSFDNVCQCLNIDAEYLRLGLKRYRDAAQTARKNSTTSQLVWKKIRRPRKR
ncbi:hypothetical protein JNK13_02505 [bacterium]|nr:hypothetical protein [bacterium]